MDRIIFLAIQLFFMVGGYLVGKYIMPTHGNEILKSLEFMSTWATNFVHYAAQYLDASGTEKMNYVCEKLREITAANGIEMTDEQIKSIIQAAYDAMKDGLKESDEKK